MKFMMAKVGPMLRTVLIVSKLMRPLLKAIIAKAFTIENTNYIQQQQQGLIQLSGNANYINK